MLAGKMKAAEFLLISVFGLFLCAANGQELDVADGINEGDQDSAQIMGDTLFTVPVPSINDFKGHPYFAHGALCYEVQGKPGNIYNLISDQCVTVNGLYNKSKESQVNLMKAISFLADGDSGKCHSVKVKRDHCHVYVNGAPMNGSFDFDGIRVWTNASSQGQRIGVSVPNCQNNTRANLTFSITCTIVLGDKALQLQVLYTDGLRPSSHGLLGQFWNINMTKTAYVGPYRGHQMSAEDKMYKVSILDPVKGDVVRSFLAELHQIQWDGKGLPCLYAGSSQASSTSKDPDNGNVIEGKYSDYQMLHLASSNFKFRKYREGGQCEILEDEEIPHWNG